jgi:hypothetical protein
MNVEKIQSPFQLIGTKIARLEFANDFVVIPTESDFISRKFDVSYSLGEKFFLDEDQLCPSAMVTMYVKAVVESEDKKLEGNLEIVGCFSFDKSIPIDEYEGLLKLNGCASLYSIARSIITSVSSHICDNSTIILPMINVFKLHEELEERN